MEENNAPENQDKPKKIFGKFDSIEQAEESYKSLEGKVTELSETSQRLERAINLMETTKSEPSNAKSDYVPYSSYLDEEDVSSLDETTRRAIEKASERARINALKDVAEFQNKRDTAQKEWGLFCEENPDLKDEVEMVTQVARSYREEIGSRNVDKKTMRVEVAKRVRSVIDRYSKRGSNKPLRVESGNEGEKGPRIIRANEADNEMPSEQDIVDTYIKDFRAQKQKKLIGR